MWSQIKVLRPRQAARPFLTLEIFTSGQQLGHSGPVKPRCRKAPQKSVIFGRAAADEGSEEALYWPASLPGQSTQKHACWASQLLVRELGALVQPGSSAGQQGLLILPSSAAALPPITPFWGGTFLPGLFSPPYRETCPPNDPGS